MTPQDEFDSLPAETNRELIERLVHTLRAMPTPEAQGRILPHLRWGLCRMFKDVDPRELTSAELLIVSTVMTTAQSRWLMSQSSSDEGTTASRLQLVRE